VLKPTLVKSNYIISPFIRLLLGMGGERSSKTRLRLAGKICCFCGRYLDRTLWQAPGE
jgi:hypothetical protein